MTFTASFACWSSPATLRCSSRTPRQRAASACAATPRRTRSARADSDSGASGVEGDSLSTDFFAIALGSSLAQASGALLREVLAQERLPPREPVLRQRTLHRPLPQPRQGVQQLGTVPQLPAPAGALRFKHRALGRREQREHELRRRQLVAILRAPRL